MTDDEGLPRPRARLLETTASANTGSFTAKDWGLFASMSLLWGSSFLFIAIALEAFEPGLITWGRVGLGALVLNVSPRARPAIDPDDRRRMVALSLLWVGIPFTLFPIAEQHINSAVTGMLNGGMPIFAAIVAGLVARRFPPAGQVVGLLVGLAGVVAISVSQSGEDDSAWIGVVLVIAATICYGIAINIAAPLQQRYGSMGVMGRMLALAAVWTAPYGILSIPGSEFDWAAVGSVVVIGALGTGLAFVLIGSLVGSVGSTRASLITYLIPVVALGLGVVLRGDRVTTVAAVGVVLVIAGAFAGSRGERAVEPVGDGGDVGSGT